MGIYRLETVRIGLFSSKEIKSGDYYLMSNLFVSMSTNFYLDDSQNYCLQTHNNYAVLDSNRLPVVQYFILYYF